MLKLIAAATFVGTLGLGSVAMADATTQEGGNQGGLRQLSWDQLQQACQNPAAFQSQRQPNAIRLTCEDSQLVWEVDRSDALEIDNQRHLTAALSSDKYYVVKQDQSVQMVASKASCPRLKEVQVNFTKSFALSCQEIQDFRGDMNAFCQSRIDSDLKANAALATRTETGRAYDLCAAPALVTQGQGKGQPGAYAGGGQVEAPRPGSKVPSLGIPSGGREMRGRGQRPGGQLPGGKRR